MRDVEATTVEALDALTDETAALVELVRGGALAGGQCGSLGETLTRLRALQAQLDWVSLAVVREVDLSGAHTVEGALTTAAWLRQRARMSPSEASTTVRTARGLSRPVLQETSRALAEGQIDLAHARLIARHAEGAPDGAVELIQPVALDAARTVDPVRVSQIMRAFSGVLDPDGEDEKAVRRYDKRGLSVATTLDGLVAGRFLLDPVTGAALLAALDAAADPLAKGDRRSPAQRNADALGDIARHFLATADAARAGGAHTQVLLAGGRLAWVGDIAESTAARVACDAQVTLVGVDTDGEARDLFTRRRYFTWTQRKAIIVRDGNQCPWPWCQRPIAWSDGHHLRPWQDGGPTTVANGALPCEGHHLLLHEGGWTLERLKDGRYLARDRHGRVIGPEPTRRPRGMRPPPRRRE